MQAGIDRSTLPGPRVITNICPSATMTKNEPKVIAALNTSPEPLPEVKAAVASQTAKAPIHAQSQGLCPRSRNRVIVAPPFG